MPQLPIKRHKHLAIKTHILRFFLMYLTTTHHITHNITLKLLLIGYYFFKFFITLFDRKASDDLLLIEQKVLANIKIPVDSSDDMILDREEKMIDDKVNLLYQKLFTPHHLHALPVAPNKLIS
jgi:hypothetical protein